MARVDQSDDWQDRHAPTISTFESMAMEAYSHLPDEFARLRPTSRSRSKIFPSDEVFDDMALETPFDLLGLFEGRGISERFTMETGELPNRSASIDGLSSITGLKMTRRSAISSPMS